MAAMDEFKEERAAIKNGTFKQKISYFWYYYKWYFIGITLAVLLIVSFVYQAFTKKDTAFNAVMLNSFLMNEDSEYHLEFADFAGIDTDKYEVFFDTSMHIIEDSMDETTYASIQKLSVYTAAAELDAMVTDTASFAQHAYSENFYDLRDVLTEEQIAMYEPYFYYVDWKLIEEINKEYEDWNTDYVPSYPDPAKPEEMAQPIPVGIYLQDCEELIKDYYFQSNDIVVGVYCNTTHLETALNFIDFLMSENK